jgi:hypothetical protein
MKISHLLLPVVLLFSTAGFAQSSPQIVAQVSLLNQNSATRPTSLFTPVTSGVYRISSYMVASRGTKSVWSLSFGWTDEHRPAAVTDLFVPNNTTLSDSNTLVVRAIAGTPIYYKVNRITSSTITYDLFITVEQLESD